MKKTIIVMPVANEGATMQHVIDEIMALPYDNLYLYPVIDSFSTDNTEQIIREAEILYNHRVKCLYYKKSTGMISCYLYGFHVALKDGATTPENGHLEVNVLADAVQADMAKVNQAWNTPKDTNGNQIYAE